MENMHSEPGYKSFFLRIWEVERDGESATVATLEDCQTGARQAFPNFVALLEFLETDCQQRLPAANGSQFTVRNSRSMPLSS
jgi:hypothetical protein